MDERITGKTKLLAIIGNPVEHTISPQLHNTLSSLLGIDATYIPIKVETEKLGDMLNGFRASNFLGFNATIPFKEKILDHIDEASEDVRLMGCANTIKINKRLLKAYNTDADGFLKDFERTAGSSLKGKKVLILGAGGTCRSLAVKIASEKASDVYLFNRTFERALAITKLINENIANICHAINPDDIKLMQSIIDEADIVINTTSAGLHPDIEGCPLRDDIFLPKGKIVYDVIYKPFKTKLLQKAELSGCKAFNGLGMLFYQGILAYEIWMDLKIPQHIIDKLYKEFSDLFK